MIIKYLKFPRAGIKRFTCILSVFISLSTFGQSDNVFKIDSVRIFFDENLDRFLSDIKSNKFVDSNYIGAIPAGIKKQLELLAGEFSIANPNADYRCCCTSSQKLPIRKLVFLSKSDHLLVMTYLTGGIGVSAHLLFVRFDGDIIRDLWFANCLEDLKSRKQIVRYINKNRKAQGSFHPNFGL